MGGDIDSLLWRRPDRPNRGPKPGLSLDRIVAVAVELADAEGLDGLSMKRLAAKLDSGVMSLYRYVPGKDELVELMLNAIYADPPQIPDGMPWREAVTRCAQVMRELFLAHPWALPMSTRAHAVGPNETAWVEAQLRAMHELDAPPAVRMHLILIVSGYVRGAVAPEASAEEGRQLRFDFLDHPETHDRFPLLAQTLTSFVPDAETGFDRFFEFGLNRVLDGIAVSFDSSSVSA